MRFGLTILPERPWAQAERQWRAAEELGFDHAWTYDHLVWLGLPDSPWYGTMPTLTAAAVVTSRIRLGTFVASPNFRHPATLYREAQSLDDVSGGRFLLGLGKGGDLDARILGQPPLTTKDRVDRFQEFTRLYLMLRDDETGRVTSEGRWFETHDMGTLPHPARVPVLAAADGPRSVRFAAQVADGWVTTGSRCETLDAWFDALTASPTRSRRRSWPPAATPPHTRGIQPRLLAGLLTGQSRGFRGPGDEGSGSRVHRRRVALAAGTSPYQGDEAMLETIASEVVPRLRG